MMTERHRKKTRRIPIAVLVAVIAAGVVFAGIGIASAIPGYLSDEYTTRISMEDIGVTLVENGKDVAHRNYSNGSWDTANGGELLADVPEDIVLEQEYPEAISVRNSGSIGEFVRVSIYRYWLDKDGNRVTALSPDLIDLNLINQGSWIEDKSASTDERLVLYYTGLLQPGETTSALSDTISIDNTVAKEVVQEKNGSKIVTKYKYDGVQFCLEATADAVQEHNAEEAILSAWGVKASVSGGTLSLK